MQTLNHPWFNNCFKNFTFSLHFYILDSLYLSKMFKIIITTILMIWEMNTINEHDWLDSTAIQRYQNISSLFLTFEKIVLCLKQAEPDTTTTTGRDSSEGNNDWPNSQHSGAISQNPSEAATMRPKMTDYRPRRHGKVFYF